MSTKKMKQDGTNCSDNGPAVSWECQLFNPHELIRVASAAHAVESDNGVSSLIPRKRLVPLDRDLEEASSGQIGNYTCPYVNCPYGNYAIGFSSRVKRNTHMLNCLYRRHGSSQGQNGGGCDDGNQIIPSCARVDRKMVATEAGPNNKNKLKKNPAESSSQIELENYSDPVTQAESRVEVVVPENSNWCNVNSQVVEPARQLRALNNSLAEISVFQNSNNNHFPEVGTSQQGFHYLTPDMGGYFDSCFDDVNFTATDEFIYDADSWIK